MIVLLKYGDHDRAMVMFISKWECKVIGKLLRNTLVVLWMLELWCQVMREYTGEVRA